MDPALAGHARPPCWSARPPGRPRNFSAARSRGHRLTRPSTTACVCRSRRPCTGSATRPRRNGWRSAGLAAATHPDLLRRPALDPGPVPHYGRPVPRIPRRAEPGPGPPGISARNRARLLVAIARTHRHLGQIEKADQVASAALAEATEADDDWAVGWALHVLTNTAAMRGRMADALPLYRPGPGGNPGRTGADRPAPAAADQQGRHAGRPRSVRRGVRRGPRGPAARRPGRHHGPPGPGALLSRRVAVPHRSLGRRPGRGRRCPGSHQGPRHGLLRPRRRRGDLPCTAARSLRPVITWPPPPRTRSGSGTGWSARWPSHAARPSSRKAR